jgi:hypothetical protein
MTPDPDRSPSQTPKKNDQAVPKHPLPLPANQSRETREKRIKKGVRLPEEGPIDGWNVVAVPERNVSWIKTSLPSFSTRT